MNLASCQLAQKSSVRTGRITAAGGSDFAAQRQLPLPLPAQRQLQLNLTLFLK
jgi:hypothetical protein